MHVIIAPQSEHQVGHAGPLNGVITERTDLNRHVFPTYGIAPPRQLDPMRLSSKILHKIEWVVHLYSQINGLNSLAPGVDEMGPKQGVSRARRACPVDLWRRAMLQTAC
jgi:hypothetical protein